MGILERTLPRALDSLRVGGRLVVESYQSLEDRIVKRTLAQGLKDTAPPGLPVVPEANRARLRALVKGALKADPTEVAQNPRSQSVRLRAVELVAPWSQS
ncbi:Ribosomal RNA small subunit methyltransferase H [bioreactor metagenome]|uniref:Ribosomal RNA small subunit methyltransferase H n=1 Tax=bioreactor metagenome TaxID=1076179 RepID=A0A645IG94_9ZZZZ